MWIYTHPAVLHEEFVDDDQPSPVQSAMRHGEPMPGTGLIQILAWVLVAVSLAAAALVLLI
jgi:hypothetical protein